MADRIGTEIAGYRIESLIARGGMGEVYLATQSFPERKVALKLLPHDLATDQAFRERFIRESNAAASVEHPNIVPVYGAGESSGELYIAMRYVQGEDLRSLLDREGPLAPERAVQICSQIADALQEAHEHDLVHRDVKPGNILISKGDRAYLTDFGLIRRSKLETDLTKTGQFMGTVDYVAPEQIKGEEVDGRADIYSLGCVLYECLTGEPPFRRDTEVATLYAHLEDPPPGPSTKNPAVPTGLDGVVGKAIAKRPYDRYATAGELSQAMRACVGALGTAAGRRRTALIVGIASTVAVIGLLTGFLLSRAGSQDRATKRPTGPPLNSVVEIDPETGSVLQIADVNLQTTFSSRIRMAVGEGGVWISNLGTVFHVDPETGATNGIPVSDVTSSLAVNFRTVWIGGFDRIDPATDKLLPPIRYRSGGCCGATGFRAVWVAADDGILVRIDPRTLKVTNEIPVGSEADDVAVGSRAVWVIDKLSGTVSRIDPKSDEVTDVIHLSGDLERIVAGAGLIWVLDPLAGIVTPIDPQGDQVGPPIQVGPKPADIAVGLGAVWVADQSDDSIYRIDPVTHIAERIPVGAPLASLVVDESHRSLWVAVAGNPVPD